MMRWSIIFSVVCLSIFGLIYLEGLDPAELERQKQVALVLQSLAVSFGAVIAAIGGFSLIGDWLKKRKQSDELIAYWQKRFPISNLEKPSGYRFVESKDSKGTIYLHNRKNNQKHWIANVKTILKLWGPNPPINTLDTAEIDKLSSGEHIDIT